MNELSIKPSNVTDPQASKTGGRTNATTLAGLASSFQDLVSKSGINFGTGLNEIAGQSGITAISDNAQSRQAADNRSDEPNDEGRDRFVDRGTDERSDRDRSEPQRTERSDDTQHDTNTAARDEHRDSNDGGNDGARDNRDGDTSSHAEKPARDDHQSNNETAGQDRDSTEQTAAGSESNGKNGSDTASDGNTNNAGEAANAGLAAAQNAGPAQALDATAIISAVGGQAQAAQVAASDGGKASAAAGAAVAAVAAQKQAGVHNAQTGTSHQQNQGQQNQAASSNAAAQQGDGGAKSGPTVQQQSAQLAQTIGQETRVSVDVSVAKEAETLTSRPTVSLAAGSAVASDAKAQGQTGQHSANPNSSATQNAQAANNANQAQNGQAQSQNQQAQNQNAQNQAALQAGTQSKSAAGNAGAVHNTGPSAAGGEIASNANSLTGNAGTQQTQQTQQSAQVANTARPQQAAQTSVAEQVSVKITKALQAGNDRITIRLNPAELGRVEVKMELNHDGRATAIVTADNKDTLDLLRRDSSDLQKALEEGGMQLSDADLNFNLRGEENQSAEDGDGTSGGKAGEEEVEEEFADAESPVIVAHEGGVLVNGRVDVRA